MRTKRIETSLDENNRPIVRVPLGKNGSKGYATLYLQDFERLMELGLSTAWNLVGKGYVTATCSTAPGNSVQVARVLLDAGAYEQVRYCNGDKTDLRTNNILKFFTGAAKRRDAEYVKPLVKSKQKKIEYVAALSNG